MAERKAKPAAKKVAVTKAAGKAAVKPKNTKAAAVATPKKVAVKKTATAAAKPKSTKTPAVKKATVPAAEKKAPAKKAAAAKPAAKKIMAQITPEERYRMVQTAAYFIAERNGFGGCSADHWVAAELEIAGKLGQ
ncbi:MAG: DUF2934 domain-containing protein [Gallionella sp.]|nr:DUF2934 domain-containing protein [Gallionella sp.]